MGLSLIIGGLVLAGTGLFYWIFGPNQTTVVKHESHNQYNEIEKYYQFLAHDKLKLSIDSVKWKTIIEIYQKYSSNYQEFVKKIKEKITGFHKEDHSGWGGKLDDSDINILIKVLFDNFHIINNSFLTNSTHGWKIVTNTIGSYLQIEIK
ncbi:hypothetical protein [Spiroplasma phoeniceum]|uniref:Transmembrane protein n=1 Tax=Spiroplasma phoeniceum P40 TaxID=1276259 RepID=A0A345DME7_9MOLU|nr:hypothetical protein [Spiroplasma phoeniceum]AXF95385.1 hypothetical protein SDAV_00391 [Spiroplasma phoeniceum P40]